MSGTNIAYAATSFRMDSLGAAAFSPQASCGTENQGLSGTEIAYAGRVCAVAAYGIAVPDIA
eukprot:1912610-Rhodomonas_salina.3